MFVGKAAHIGYITPTTGNDFVVFGAGVDDAEEGKHGLGLVAGFTEEATIIIIRVRVVGGIDQAERLESGDG
ncbi:MAG: hypothetical protein E7074_09000 [Bacteroidales bacterium]|nr:hypothetical protein [Bacteroidales bacterium]